MYQHRTPQELEQMLHEIANGLLKCRKRKGAYTHDIGSNERISSGKGPRGGNALGLVAGELKRIAREYGIPVSAIKSSVNRLSKQTISVEARYAKQLGEAINQYLSQQST